MSLPTENPYPNRNILTNLRFEKGWEKIMRDSETKETYEKRKRVSNLIAEQLLLVASCVERMCLLKKRPFHVSFIGCGQVGQILLSRLLEEGVKADDICVSSRQPELLSKFRGVRRVKDNAMAIKRGSVVFILCAPHHINHVSSQLRGLIRQNSVLVSSLSDFSREKLCAALDTTKEQTIRSRVDIHRISQDVKRKTSEKKKSYIELACSELCAEKARGIEEICSAIANLGRKLGIPNAKTEARISLLGNEIPSDVDVESDEMFRKYIHSDGFLDSLTKRCELGFGAFSLEIEDEGGKFYHDAS